MTYLADMSGNKTRFTLKVFLYEISPQIWRKFTIAGSATFAELHTVLQKAMGWEDKHQHEFRYGKGKKLSDVIGPIDEDIDIEGKFNDESELTIDQFLSRKRLPLRMLYRYDFLEDWVHELVFESSENTEEVVIPELLEGERACPPEDSGGAWGYMSAMDGDVEWMDDEYDPEFFDAAEVQLSK